jgi:hypothetical protein
MIPTTPTDHDQAIHADDNGPRFFLNDAFDATTDGDWWLDLGHIDLPAAPPV